MSSSQLMTTSGQHGFYLAVAVWRAFFWMLAGAWLWAESRSRVGMHPVWGKVLELAHVSWVGWALAGRATLVATVPAANGRRRDGPPRGGFRPSDPDLLSHPLHFGAPATGQQALAGLGSDLSRWRW
jgi:hypothetical protein